MWRPAVGRIIAPALRPSRPARSCPARRGAAAAAAGEAKTMATRTIAAAHAPMHVRTAAASPPRARRRCLSLAPSIAEQQLGGGAAPQHPLFGEEEPRRRGRGRGRHRALVYSSLHPPPPPAAASSSAPVDYVRGWAWQQALLERRLAARRRARQRRPREEDPAAGAREEGEDLDDDPDVVLLLEHDHVVTLGRGADEAHLRFLAGPGSGCPRADEARRRLARASRGPGSARLSLDRGSPTATPPMATPATATATAADELDRQAAERAEHLCAGVVPVVAPNGAPVYRVERGGECTYHGPGQLVVYPMLDLTRRRRRRGGGSSGTGGPDLHDYLRRIEGVVIRTLAEYGVRGERDADHTGVWVGPSKVAAVGVSASRWITTHGFAINVRPDLAYFDTSVILPCGIDGRGVTSLAEIMGESAAPTVLEVSRVVMEELSGEFDLDVEATRHIPPAR